MKVLLKERQYKKLIREVKGVSESSIMYINLIYNELEKLMYKLIARGKKFEGEVRFDLHEIVPLANENIDSFIDFPIEDIVISLTLMYNKKPTDSIGKTFSTNGAAYPITEVDEDEDDGEITLLIEPSSELPLSVLENVDKVLFIPLAWNFFKEIQGKIKAKRDREGDVFVKYFPTISVN